MPLPPEPDPWSQLRATTRARIGLGRVGDAMPIKDVLEFQLAHAKARDAVHTKLATAALKINIQGEVIEVRSAAQSREIYLRRPDLGRQLHSDCEALLTPGDYDAVFVIADGLSATAVSLNAVPMLKAVLSRLHDFKIAPVVIATQARVAIGDDIGERLGAKLCVMLIGERPGLSVAESLGIYLTYHPKRGTRDSARNCISNIHGKGGLSYEVAADTLAWLMRESLRRKLTGVDLKEEALLAPPESMEALGTR
ncbi:MAG: ethanolamine ammonia-lyase subunit EutC [Acidocella sp.]|nr:ethanolamine ammonia-lyase subunit EutC [Acidocella sp.]